MHSSFVLELFVITFPCGENMSFWAIKSSINFIEMGRKWLVWLLIFSFVFNNISPSLTWNESSEKEIHPDYEIVLTMEKPREFISSPGFPYKYYPPNIQIIYKVKIKLEDELLQMGTRLLLTMEFFAVEDSAFCAQDGIEIADTSNQVQVFCGSQTGRTILSEGSEVMIRFFSDSSSGSRGYSIRLEMFNAGCSKLFKAVPTGSLASPNFPNKYQANEICVWKIEAPKGKRIRLKFDKRFDLRAFKPYCVQDYLAISIVGDFAEQVKRYCQTESPGVIESESTTLLLMMQTDGVFEGQGFQATFEVFDEVPIVTEPPPKPRPNLCHCGIENVGVTERIIGGTTVDPPNKYPWVVALVRNKQRFFCGGALINSQYILTAAHCLERESISNTSVALEAHESSDHSYLIDVSDFKMHPQFETRKLLNDIALVKLQEPVKFGNKVRPLCLSDGSNIGAPNDVATVAGWGLDSIGGLEAEKLQEIKLAILSHAVCLSKYRGAVLETNLCAGGEEGRDACSGDSGGNLFGKYDGVWFSVGVTSWGIGCAREGHPGVYTRVSKYLDWIEQESSDAQPCEDVEPPIQPNIKECGIPNTKEGQRIAGGSETKPFEYPWMALIVNNKSVAGVGVLISPAYVLTSASLFDSFSWVIWYPEVLDVFLGRHRLSQKDSVSQRYDVVAVVVHPGYGQPSPYNNDMALLKLRAKPEEWPKIYRPVCLPRSDFSYPPGTPMTIAGWGRISTKGQGSDVLLHATMKVISLQHCSSNYPGWVTKQMICAYNRGKDTCEGDSGAPLMYMLKGRYYVAGVSSWGSKDGCAMADYPRVFAATQRNLRWISDQTGLSVA